MDLRVSSSPLEFPCGLIRDPAPAVPVSFGGTSMSPRYTLSRCCRTLAAALLAVLGGWAAPAAAQTPAAPYVFFLFDTSGSMNWSPPCPQDQLAAGACGFLCPTGDCFVPMQGDDPASKLYQLKAGLYTSIAQRDDLLLGFTSLNQDALGVRAKHWLYQATSSGPTIGSWGPFPAVGAQEVFGLLWSCDTGSNDNEIGCYASKPADLDDPWELARVQRLPKGGVPFNQSVTFFIRSAGIVYRAQYVPISSAVPGASTIRTTVTLNRCTNAACSTFTLVGSQTVTWQLVSDFVSWDIADSVNTNRTNPLLTYFESTAASDASATNTCAGWEPNTDTTADRFSGYTLHWPTDSSDSRGLSFSIGDVIPMDWNNSHKLDVEKHLAPNLVLNPTATPDFRIATYLNDNRLGSETFLRVKSESTHLLIASGATPLGAGLASFRTWYSGCSGTCTTPGGWQAVAAVRDPDWANRHVSVVLVTDGDETCGGDPCSQASALYSMYGVKTFIVAFGMQPVAGSAIECAAANGGTVSPYYPQTKQELVDDLALIYAAAANP
jgi:hypothetical protein